MPDSQCSLYALRDGAAWITLNRPAQRNALSARLVNELYEHLQHANADPAVRCIVLTGAGTGFCAGADLKDPPLLSGAEGASVPDLLSCIWEGEKPVIAAVNGAAFAGGLGLVGAADIVVTVDEAQFSFSEVRIGVIPAIIAVVCLRKIGPHHGMRLFLSGERFTGVQAVGYGLAHRAVPRDGFMDAIEAEVAALKMGGPNALVECKKLVRALEGTTLHQGFELTEQWSKEMFKSKEATEGMAAFREKRKPAWIASGAG